MSSLLMMKMFGVLEVCGFSFFFFLGGGVEVWGCVRVVGYRASGLGFTGAAWGRHGAWGLGFIGLWGLGFRV